MKITVRLFATLREGRGKELILETEEGATPREIAESLEIPAKEVAILLINGRDGKLDDKLKDSDKISLFPPLGGG